MKLFSLRGGLSLAGHKGGTAGRPIRVMPAPPVLHLPLRQHAGDPAKPVVAEGDTVRRGERLAESAGPLSAPLHAPAAGRVTAVRPETAPHPSGLPAETVVLETAAGDDEAPLAPPVEPEAAAPGEIAARVGDAGIVGLGGGAFPAAVKLDLGHHYALDTLVINGAECEPYLTADDQLMREKAPAVVDGARVMAAALGVGRVVVGIEANKPRALEAMRTAAGRLPDGPAVVALPVRYPMGSERHLVQVLTGRETPSGRLTAEVGVVVHNAGTARAVHDAVRQGRPLTHRVVTVSGGAVRRPANVMVPLGTRVRDLVAFCGGLRADPARLLAGGPFTGNPLPGLDVPVVKGFNGILALTADEARERPAQPCIRCGACVEVCPCGLVPVEMMAHIRKEELDDADTLGVRDCVRCGSCAYACPSHIPLVQYFAYAQGRLRGLDVERRNQDLQRVAARERQERMARLERERQEKKARQARRRQQQDAEQQGGEAPRKADPAAAGPVADQGSRTGS